jgi:hypothetical protein
MTNRISRIAKRAIASLIKFAMAVTLLVAMFGIPYWIITSAWDLLEELFHQHTIGFAILIIPILYLAIKLWKWLYTLLGSVLMAVGSIVDRLEREDTQSL